MNIHDIATAAGVSISTVSRAFSEPDRVSPRTLERIRRVAMEADFIPNRTARGLVTGRLNSIGIVLPDITNPFFPPVVKSITERATAADQTVVLATTEHTAQREQMHIRRLQQQTDGVIICSPTSTDENLSRHAGRKPVVLVNHPSTDLPHILVDTAPGMREAIRHLRGLGHRKVTYISGPAESWSNQQRQAAVHAECAAVGIESRVIGPYPPDFEAGLLAADELLYAADTAAVAFDDQMALGVLARLRQRNVRVPDEMSVIGCDDVLPVGLAQPALTTVTASASAAGAAAADLLNEAIGGTVNTEPIRIGSRLLLRSSTGPRGT